MILCACGGGVPTPRVVQGLLAVTRPDDVSRRHSQLDERDLLRPRRQPAPVDLGWYAVPGRAEQASVSRTDFTKIEGGGNGPMLIVQGKNDIVAPPSIGHELRKKYGPGSQSDEHRQRRRTR